jgi:hypothetical protein
MFRSFFRVAVVAVVALSLTLSLAPVAQAQPQETKPAVVAAGGGWFEAAKTWLSRLVAAEKQPKPGTVKAADATPNYGSCIDPWGICL